ncbi:MAG: M16 family metallopeptidase [Candidatus Aminicenantales bacterium]
MIGRTLRCCVLVVSMALFPARAAGTLSAFRFPVTHYTLGNGLQVLLSEDHTLPIVSVVVAYRVGSIHERQGKTGLAYLVQNLMFQGSRNVGQMQHIRFIQKIGGTLNAATMEDKTLFYQTVPANQLALVLWLESDRMRSLNISSAGVESIKNSLLEEIQLRRNTDPYFENSVMFDSLLYGDFPHSHPVVGTEADIRSIAVRDVREFYKTFYRPNNAVLVIAGDIEVPKVHQLIIKYFSTIPKGPPPPPPPRVEPEELKPSVHVVRNSFAPSPAFHMGYRVAAPLTEDYYALVLTEYVLLRGRTSRLYKKLVLRDRIALDLSGGIERKADRAVFKIFVRANNQYMKERCQKAIFSEFNRFKSSLLPEKELERAKNLLKRDFLRQYATTLDRAIYLAEELMDRRDVAERPDALDRYLSLSRHRVSRMITKYFSGEPVILDIQIQ